MTQRQIRISHKQFLRRQLQYERRFARMFLAVLSKQYREAADVYPQEYIPDPNDYRRPLELLYSTCLPREAEICWGEYVKPLAGDRKDFFDDLMAILGINVPEGEFIRIWRDVAREWLSVNVTAKITSISQTTRRAIAKIIQDGINEGLSIPNISKRIREQSNGQVNRHRSVVIARTETISAMNKGRRLSMYSSNLMWNKRWVDTPDARTRMSHRLISQETWRELDAKYWLVNSSGGLEAADCPGDPALSAENIIQCRCAEAYEVQRDSAGRPIRRVESPTLQESRELVEFI